MDVIQPYTLFLFQWLIFFTFAVVGDGYYQIFFWNRKSEEENLLVAIFHRLVFGMGLLIILQFVVSFLFSAFTIISVGYLLLGVILSTFHLLKTVTSQGIELSKIRNKVHQISENKHIILFTVGVIFISIITSFSLSGYVGSTNHDAATHTFYVRIILEQQKTPLTAQPFNSYYISYPLGVHSLLATFVVLGTPIYSVVILSTSLLPFLSAIAAYSSCLMIFKSPEVAVLSGLITGLCSRTIIASLGWGGVTIGIANVFVLALLGYVFEIFTKHRSKFTYLVSGIILGIMPWLHPAAAVFTYVFVIICVVSSFFVARWNQPNYPSTINILKRWIVFGFTVIVFLVPYLLRMASALSISNQGYPSDVPNLPSSGLDSASRGLLSLLRFNILLDILGLSYYGSLFGSVFWIFPYSLFAALIVTLLRRSNLYKDYFKTNNSKGYLSIYPILIFYLSLLSYILILYYMIPSLPSNSIVSVSLQAILVRLFYEANLLLIPLTAFTLYSIIKLIEIAFREGFFLQYFGKGSRRRIITWMVIVFVSTDILVLTSACVYADSNLYYRRVVTSQALYNTLTSDDINLLQWMSANLPKSSTILIGYNDAGEYVSAVTGFRTIYEYAERIRSSTNYNNLLSIISTNPLNGTALPLLEGFNITHIFIGAKSQVFTSGQVGYTLNASDLLRAPWFEYAYHYGNATLLSYSP